MNQNQKGWNKTNATNYEHYCIDYYRNHYDETAWHWTQIPEIVLYESGFVHDFNNLRMKRKERFEEEGTYYNPVREYGLDGISKSIDDENNVIYNGIQSKLWERSLRAHDLGSFYQVIFTRMRKHNNKSKGYLYHNGKLQVDVRDDILNLRGDILNIHLPYNENIQNDYLGNITTTNTIEIMEEKDYILRDYQKEAIEKLNMDWYGIKLLQLPCGMGKTLIFNHHAKDKDYKNVFIISPLRIHTKQNLDRMKAYLPEHKALLLDSDGSTDFKDLEKIINEKSIISTTFDSAQTLFSQLFEKEEDSDDEEECEDLKDNDEEEYANEVEEELICKYDLSNSILIVDEAHNLINKDELNKIIRAFPKVLLVTATPPSCMEEIIGCEVIYQYEFRKAIEEKHICDYQIYLPIIEKEGNIKIDIPEELIELNRDITKKCLFLLNGMLHTGSRKCIVYLNSKEDCEQFVKNIYEVNNKYHYLPLWCNKIVSETSEKERSDIIKEFEKNDNEKIKIICSIRILNEGVDIPNCDSIFITNIGDYSNDIVTVQRLCRANRIVKENPNKMAHCFMWSDDLNKCINTLSLLKENDIDFYKKIKILNANYEKKYEKESTKVEESENKALQEFINIKCMSLSDIWEMKKNLLFEYCNEYNRLPKNHELYKDITIGSWYHHQIGKINNKKIYDSLSFNDIVKNALIQYLNNKMQNKYKKYNYYTFDEWLDHLNNFYLLYKRLPKSNEKFNNITVGLWLNSKKKYITSKSDDMYIKLSKIDILKDFLNKHIEEKFFDNKFEKNIYFFYNYCNENNKIPSKKENLFLNKWFERQKKKINSINDDLYKILSKNNIVKIELDIYLKNKEKSKLTWNEWESLLYEYIDINKKMPVSREIYKGVSIGNWVQCQKRKINSIEDIEYKILSKNNIIKEALDNNLGITNKWDEAKEKLFEYCNLNKKMPIRGEKYKEYSIRYWYEHQKIQISSINDELYKKLSENKIVKKELDKFLSNKK